MLHEQGILVPSGRVAGVEARVGLFGSLWDHRDLVWQMTKRDVISRYRGSALGLLWSLVHPLVMLVIYTFVFGVVFRARWEHAHASHPEFALVLFAGLIVYSFFAECVNRAPGLVTGNPGYVKKVVFPLEILPWVVLGSAIFHAVVSFGVLAVLSVALRGVLPWTVVVAPIILAPLMLLAVGASWFLAPCGAYLRDTGQVVTLGTVALLFSSPVFYPVSALPERLQPYAWLNPLTFGIEALRDALFWGQLPRWDALALQLGLGLVVAWLGLTWFQRLRPGFADVV